MNHSHQQELAVHFDGHTWQAIDANKNMLTLSVAEGETLPNLPEHAVVSNLLLPTEALLLRTFTLPFAKTKFIDQDILAQEIEEHTSEKSEAWWLSWQAGVTQDGVAGIIFGLPESLRQQIDTNDGWQHV